MGFVIRRGCLLLLLWLVSAAVLAQVLPSNITPQQQQMLNALSPQMRQQAMDAYRQSQAGQAGSAQTGFAQPGALTPEQHALLEQLPPYLQQQVLNELRNQQLLQGMAPQQPLSPEQRALLEQLPPDLQQQVLTRLRTAAGAGAAQPSLQMPDDRLSRMATEAIDLPTLADDPRSRSIEDQELRQFGYDIFTTPGAIFDPTTDIPVPSSYVLGPGDTITVQLYGKDNFLYEDLPIDREGVLNFPGLGPMSVAGRTFADFKTDLEERVSEQMIGTRASVSVGRLRSIRVFVLGDVVQPRSYVVSALSTITSALAQSGGIQPMGSLRRVQLKRQGEVVTTLDLYDLMLRGDTSSDLRLQAGDVIFVPPIGRTVGVAGEVRRPGIYELRGGERVANVISLAGGLLPTAYKKEAQLERVQTTGERLLLDVNLATNAGQNMRVQDGDVVRVYSALGQTENVVLLTGHFDRPGGLQWQPGMRILDAISNVEALLPRPDLRYVLIRREVPPNRRVRAFSVRLDEAFANPASSQNVLLQPRDEILVFGQEESRGTPLPRDLRREVLGDTQSMLVGPTGTAITSAFAQQGTSSDPGQQAGPVPPATRRLAEIVNELRAQASSGEPEKVVNITGQVRYPGAYPLEPGMRVNDLLRAGGYLRQDAFTMSAEMTRFEGVGGLRRESEHLVIDLAAASSGKATANLILQPFDSLHIKQLPQWSETQVVTLRGEVKFPGTYVIRRGETLGEVLQRAGGLTELAYARAAVFTRIGLRQREQEELRRLRARIRADVAATSLGEIQADPTAAAAVATAQQLLRDIEAVEAVGRLVIDLPRIVAGESDVALTDGDLLFVPPEPTSVTVIGEVHYPTSHLFDNQLDLEDYIGRSGGFSTKADKGAVYVVKADGSVIARSGSAWFSRGLGRIDVGDTIVVPLDADRVKPLTLWTSVSQIFAQLAVAIAALNSVNVF